MPNQVIISFALGTLDAEVPLGFEAWIDDQKFHDIPHVTDTQNIKIEINDDNKAEHELRLVMKNKTLDHTQIDHNGNIVSDATLCITDLAIDGIVLGHTLTEQSTYTHDFNGTGTMSDHKFYSEMGCNGTVSVKFTTPVYLWLLEHM